MCYCFRRSTSTSSTCKAVMHSEALYIHGKTPTSSHFFLKCILPSTNFPRERQKKTVQFSGYTGKDIYWSELMDKHRFQASLLHFSDSDVICYLISPLSYRLSSGLTKCNLFSTRHRDAKYNYDENCKH